MLALGAAIQILAHALRAWNPPFPLFVVTFWLASLGQAYQDTHGNTYVAGVKGAHRWLAFIHAMYMAGCLVGPFVSTAVASAGATSRWYLFYTVPLGIGVVNLALVLVAFRDSLRFKRAAPSGDETGPESSTDTSTDAAEASQRVSRNKGAMMLIKETVRLPSVWLLSTFFFFYLGAVLTASGWVVEYLVDVRKGSLSQMGYVPAGFNGGALLGRLLLAEPTHRFGARRMVFGYVLISIALQLVFWLVPNIIAASIAVSFIGFFTGPLFATVRNTRKTMGHGFRSLTRIAHDCRGSLLGRSSSRRISTRRPLRSSSSLPRWEALCSPSSLASSRPTPVSKSCSQS
ncbi:hypothetical protein JDV02_002069 [Purpureocillium takamizusanense]|uniref:Major facilitator superfamily (MFS) profile domain-containing protein n=1 Tax=Purpureocillium takamizusanense TaxID=2060973 RepID=A0A9Q8V731_9HYPO|nr:uncharacterized protein JDV02_002069 [Purpureocillium takamizusanense]UNI15545.1 hypothetical protein JDV02_002069 [Purpureocillium takamizusanense]